MTLSPAPVRRLALSLALAAPVLGGVAPGIVAATPAKTQAVTIRSFAFTPQIITVAPGTTVTWTNMDEDPHTVTANDKSFHSPALDTGGKFSFTFTRPGEFAYFCSLHPHMTGKVIVKG
ncbi:MAG: cupredoxin family copper-binding protein [Sphingomonas sp.]